MRPRICIFWLAILLAVLVVPGMGLPSASDPASANTSRIPGMILHPESLEFTAYLEDEASRANASPLEIWLDRGWGSIPPPIDLAYLKGRNVVPPGKSFPAQFDLRSEGRVTPVQSQGLCRSDWAFAVYSALESSLLPGSGADFSEDSLKTMHGFDIPPCDGGNEFMAIAYLTRGDGPLERRTRPYLPLFPWAAPSGEQIGNISVLEGLIVPDRSGPLDNDNLKWAVMRYGAVYTTMYWQQSYIPFLDPYYSSLTHSYCYQQPDPASNHAVTIVGWDDAYERNNFKEMPAGDGAFIVKNTWGTLFGGNGYTYVSYYDTGIGRRNTVFSAVAGRDRTSVYQYDPLGWTGTLELENGTETAWYANIYTAQDAHALSAVGFYTSGLDTEYKVFVHLEPDSGPVNQTEYVRSRSGVAQLPGYHTVYLDPVVPLTPGQKFSVVVRINASEGRTGIPAELPLKNYSSRATAHAGESFVSSDGRSWVDVATRYPDSNVCIKAFSGISRAESLSSSPEETPAPPRPVLPKSTVMSVPITSAVTPPSQEQTAVPTTGPTPKPTPRPYQGGLSLESAATSTPAVPVPGNNTTENPPPTPAPTTTPTPTPVPETPPAPALTPTPEPTIAPDTPQPPDERPTKKPKPDREDRGKKENDANFSDLFLELATRTIEPSESPTAEISPTPSIAAPIITETTIAPSDEGTGDDDDDDDDEGDDDDEEDADGDDREERDKDDREERDGERED